VRFRSRPLEQVMRASFFQIMASIRKGKIKTPTEQQPGKESSEETPLSPVAQKTETVTVPSKRQLEEALPSTGEQSPVADDASEEDADTQDIDCPSSEPSYVALLHQQQRHLPKVIKELQWHKRKVSCWAWYVFPTDKEGNADPYGTRVSPENAAHLCTYPRTCAMWQQALEKLCELMEEAEGDGMDVLPSIDHGRVHFFINFWKGRPGTPQWMADVCARLDKFDWPRW